MKRTRFIAIALAVLIAVAFVSCDGDNATPPQKECEHDFAYETIAEPTCSAEGEFARTCKICGFTESRKIPLKSHKFNYQVKDDGHEGTCTVCGHTTGVEEHTYGYCSISAEEHHKVCTKCGFELAGSNGAHVYVDYRCEYCSAWGKGPTGGYVFYDCDADNNPNINEGRGRDNLMSSECGWRFLEAAPADLRLIKGKPTVDSSAEGYAEASEGNKKFNFGFYRKTPDGENLPIDAKKEVGTGKENTIKFYEAMDETNGYRYATSTKPFNEYPARLCSILEYMDADGNTYGDWFLPSLEEIKLMSSFLDKDGSDLSSVQNYFHSSVTGSGLSSLDVWAYSKKSNYWFNSNADRSLQASIRPIRSFLPET